MCPACYQDGGSLLHCLSTLTSASEAVYFCCTGLGVTSTGRYPASCPAKPGLSSSEPFRLFSRDYLAWLRKCYSSTFFALVKKFHSLLFTPFSVTLPKFISNCLRQWNFACMSRDFGIFMPNTSRDSGV